MVRRSVKMAAAAQAGKQEGTTSLTEAFFFLTYLLVIAQKLSEIVRGSFGIAQVKLHRPLVIHQLTDNKRSCPRLNPHDVANEKIAGFEFIFELIHYNTKKQRIACQCLIVLAQALEQLMQLMHDRFAIQFEQEIFRAACHPHGLADRSTTLSDKGINNHIAGKRSTHYPFAVDLFPLEQCVHSGLICSRSHSAEL